jgi:phosphate transport system permease protein
MSEPARFRHYSDIVDTPEAVRRRKRRNAAERRFRHYGLIAIVAALSVLGILMGSIVYQGYGAFFSSVVSLEIHFDPELIDPGGTRSPEALAAGDYRLLARNALRAHFPDVSGRKEKRRLYGLLSMGAGYDLQDMVLANPELLGTSRTLELPLSDDADLYVKGHVSKDLPEDSRRLRDDQIAWLDALMEKGLVERVLSQRFLLSGDSREPELAGIGGALVGSILTLLVTLLVCFPVGVAAAVHLEEFAAKNRWTDLIEININNLAAVPSIIFGVLGLAVLLGFFGMPRSAALVGGVVLGLRTLPIVIIAARSALAAVPPSIREAAQGVGSSPLQVVTHHVLPVAMPGILTGTIIAMAQALGETAPLLMVGMVAFIVDVPGGFTSPATVLPVQIFLWADAPERAFVEKTSGAIIILLGLLIAMNATAVVLRQRLTKRL